MAKLYPNIHQIFRFIQICGIISNTWPNNCDNGKFVFILREIDWTFAFLNIVIVEILLMCAVYKYWDDTREIQDIRVMKAAAQGSAGMEMLFNLIIFKLKNTRMQKLLKEIEEFLHTSNNNETTILQKYTNRYFYFFVFVLICHCSVAIGFCCGPIFLLTKFPIEVWYPFSTESPIVFSILYAGQVYIVIKAALHFIVNFIFAMFFLYSSARLELLYLELQNAKNKSQINTCIKKHQKIIKFVNETKHTVQYTIYKTNLQMASVIIFAVFPIIRKQSFWVSSQFIFMVACGSQRLYVTAWTADDLKENSEQLAMKIYDLPWFQKSQYNTKDLCFMIQRSQVPLEISIRGFMPALSLEYFTKYVLTVSSYFTAMRTIIGD